MSTLWLLRHVPVLAALGLCYGRTDLACAVEATRSVAQAIAPTLPVRIDIFSSPLQRCTLLAGLLSALRPDLGPTRMDSRLAEMDFGAWEGRPWSDIGRAEFAAWMDDFADGRVGGHGESTRQFMARVGSAWDDWRASGRDALWVTHAGVMRAVTLLESGIRCPTDAAAWPKQSIGFGELIKIRGVNLDLSA